MLTKPGTGFRISNSGSTTLKAADLKKKQLASVSPGPKTPAMNWWKHLDPDEGTDELNNSNSSSGNNTSTPVKKEELTRVQVDDLVPDPYSFLHP